MKRFQKNGRNIKQIGNYKIGTNSEHVRHAIQDRFIHGLIKDGGFKNQSWKWNPYFQAHTKNKFTSW